MADNVVLNAGTGGATAAADDIGGIHYPRVKLSLGADGSAVDAVAGAGAVSTAVQRVTLASDDPAVALLGTMDTDTGAMVTALQILDNIVSGSEAQVDIVAALPTGANTIGAVNIAAAQTLATVTTVGTVTTITNPVTAVGAAAEDAAASGNPVLVGGRYDSSARTLETGDAGAIALNASGQVLVEIAAGAGSGGTAMADGATFTRNTTSLTPAGAVVESSAPTLNNGDVAGLSQDTTGNLRVRVAAGGIAGAAIDTATGGTDEGVISIFTRDDALATLTPAEGDNVQGRTNARGALWVALDSTAAQTVTLAAETTKVIGTVNVAAAQTLATVTTVGTLTSITNWGNIVDDAAVTAATTRVSMAGYMADETATDSVDEGDGGMARMTLDRKQIVTLAPHTAGGPTIFRSLDIDESEEEIKASAGQIYWIHAMNMVATARYLKFYNATAANVTVGSTTPVLTFPIPANSTTGAGFVFNIPQGIPFSTAISVACTTGVADADTGAPGANDVIINIGYA